MEWKNLKSNRCPQCRADLTRMSPSYKATKVIVCPKDCGFHIGQDKFEEIVGSITRKNLKSFSKENSLEDLNNL